MWYVSKVERIYNDRIIEYPSALCSYGPYNVASVRITLTNSDTHEVWISQQGMFCGNLVDVMVKLAPYGFCQLPTEVLFVRVDLPSVQLLSCIGQAKILRGFIPQELNKFISSMRAWCVPWDSGCTLIEVNGSQGQGVFPLFSVMCFLGDDAWLDGKFYMRPYSQSLSTGFCIEFTDIERVRLMLTKALVAKYNPVHEWLMHRYSRSRGKI